MKRVVKLRLAIAALLALALFCVALFVPREKAVVGIKVIGFTNRTDTSSLDASAVPREPYALPPALLPATHVVLQLTNWTGSMVFLGCLLTAENTSADTNGWKPAWDVEYAGSGRLPRRLRPGETATIEMKIPPGHRPWKTEVSYFRSGGIRGLLAGMNRFLPKSAQAWLSRNYFKTEVARLEMDAIPDSTRPSLPP
jgi:hypothetical protein